MNLFSELKRRNVYKVAVACAVGTMLAATAVCADEITIVSNVLGPEGPLYIDGNLYYVGVGFKHAVEVGWQNDHRVK